MYNIAMAVFTHGALSGQPYKLYMMYIRQK